MTKKQILFEGKYLRLLREKNWEYVERMNISGIVIIIAITDNCKLILVEQYRAPVSNSVIELPAGLVGDIPGNENECMKEAAKRELLEETGYEASRMDFITEGPPSAGLSKEIITFFYAKKLKKTGKGGGDSTENIKVHEVPLKNIEKWINKKIKQGFYIDPKVFTGIYFAIKKTKAEYL